MSILSVNQGERGAVISPWKPVARHSNRRRAVPGTALTGSAGWRTCYLTGFDAADTQRCEPRLSAALTDIPVHPPKKQARKHHPLLLALPRPPPMTSEFPWEPVVPKQGHGDGSQVMMSSTLQRATLMNFLWSREREHERKRNTLFLSAISATPV